MAQAEDNQGEYSAVLQNMAQVYLTRGDLDRALALYQESLQLKEQLGDKQGKAASLSQWANVCIAQGAWDEAERYLIDALTLSQQLKEPAGVAFKTVKRGQVAQARGDHEIALPDIERD